MSRSSWIGIGPCDDVTATDEINCDCGTVLRGSGEDEIVTEAIDHAKTAHSMTITREQVLAICEQDLQQATFAGVRSRWGRRKRHWP